MRNSVVYGVMRRRKGLAQHLTAKYLSTTNVAAFASANVVLDALELQEMN